jgi:hypothetical protein
MYIPADQVRDWIDRIRKVQPQAGDPFNVIFPPAVEVRYEPALADCWMTVEGLAGEFTQEGGPSKGLTMWPETKHWNQCNRPGDRCDFISHCWDGDDSNLVKLADLLGSAKPAQTEGL